MNSIDVSCAKHARKDRLNIRRSGDVVAIEELFTDITQIIRAVIPAKAGIQPQGTGHPPSRV
jgi:hypothetical protein